MTPKAQRKIHQPRKPRQTMIPKAQRKIHQPRKPRHQLKTQTQLKIPPRLQVQQLRQLHQQLVVSFFLFVYNEVLLSIIPHKLHTFIIFIYHYYIIESWNDRSSTGF